MPRKDPCTLYLPLEPQHIRRDPYVFRTTPPMYGFGLGVGIQGLEGGMEGIGSRVQGELGSGGLARDASGVGFLMRWS